MIGVCVAFFSMMSLADFMTQKFCWIQGRDGHLGIPNPEGFGS